MPFFYAVKAGKMPGIYNSWYIQNSFFYFNLQNYS